MERETRFHARLFMSLLKSLDELATIFLKQ